MLTMQNNLRIMSWYADSVTIWYNNYHVKTLMCNTLWWMHSYWLITFDAEWNEISGMILP